MSFLRSAALSQNPVAPSDPALPGVELVVDRRWLRTMVGDLCVRHLGVPPGGVELHFDGIRYKPGVKLTVVVRVETGEETGPFRVVLRAFARGESASWWEKLESSDVPPTARAHDEAAAIVAVAFPWDRELPGLLRFTADRDGAGFVRRLLPHYRDAATRLRTGSYRPHLLRYKPERHAVYRLEFTVANKHAGTAWKERLIARVFPPDCPPYTSADRLGGVTPRTLATDAYRGVTVEEFFEGTPLDEYLENLDVSRTTEALPVLRRIGESLRRLHEAPSREPFPVRDTARAIEAKLSEDADFLSSVDRSVAERHRSVAARILDAGFAPDGHVRVHGDLHAGQVLTGDDRVAFVDVEKSRPGPASWDLGGLIFSLREQVADTRTASDTERMIRELLAGYETESDTPVDRDELARAGALAALLRSTAPIRNLDPAWVTRVRELLGEAERWLYDPRILTVRRSDRG